jgi:CheY-like chemotaxis protein/HPt (histidine-containing phosphotransfer) domain-containing protein
VLLVDDNATMLTLLSHQLSHAGFEVVAASSASAALEILRAAGNASFDVAILDHHMPGMDGVQLGERIVKSPELASTRVLLLTSPDRSDDMQRFADIGFCAYLTKPVRMRELFGCLHRTLSHEAQQWHLRSQPIVTRGSLTDGEPKRQFHAKVLLVEDNLINQRVAQRILERLGCVVQIAGDGAQAVAACSQDEYQFVLMDMQMPIMDGLEATQRIRALETAGKRIPIVALTADAMTGTLERCLAAGMDDYLTKPLDVSRLREVLERFVGSSTDVPVAASPMPVQPASAPACDASIRTRLAEIAGDDLDFMSELVSSFILSGEESLAQMHAALQRNDRASLARAAHKLRGASDNMHMKRLATLASTMEIRCRGTESGDWSDDIATMNAEFERVSEELRAQLDEPSRRAAG